MWDERIEIIREIAIKRGWTEIDHQENIFMLSFTSDERRVNVYYSKMTVATALRHPTSGNTQIYRRNVGYKLLKKIFDNPRVHTGLGYWRKRNHLRTYTKSPVISPNSFPTKKTIFQYREGGEKP